MQILQEMQEFRFPIELITPRVHCKVFEDNSGALEMAKVHTHCAQTKHINTSLPRRCIQRTNNNASNQHTRSMY